jgi:hypothetical protein
MRVTLALKNIGIDPIYWKVWWEAIQKGYDAKDLLYSVGLDQVESKAFLVKNLPYETLFSFDQVNVHIYGGWFGYPLIDMLLEKLDINKITNIDCDNSAIALCRKYTALKNLDHKVFFREHKVEEPLNDGSNKDKDVRLVINTSSEHMPDLPELIKNKNYTKNCVFILQSNNMFHIADQHINCCNSVYEFIEKSQLKKIWFYDTIKMPNGYERYMVIGNHNE